LRGSITDLPMETFSGAAGIVPVKDPLPSNEANVTGAVKNSSAPALPGSYNAHHSTRGEGCRQT